MKIKTNVRFASSIGFSKNLWTDWGFFLVMFKFYTFGLWFNYNHWVKVCYFIHLVHVSFIDVGLGISIKNLNFSFLGQGFQFCLLGLKGCRLRFASGFLLKMFNIHFLQEDRFNRVHIWRVEISSVEYIYIHVICLTWVCYIYKHVHTWKSLDECANLHSCLNKFESWQKHIALNSFLMGMTNLSLGLMRINKHH